MNRTRTPFRPAALIAVSTSICLWVAACSGPGEDMPAASGMTAFEGARLIIGDGEVIENATFTVEGDEFVAVGATSQVDVPEGATRVDLTGMTVMPAIIDAHVHMRTTRDELIEDLRRRAAFGVGAALTMGTDPAEETLALRDGVVPGAARYASAGRGITAPEPGRSDVPHWVTTEEEARQAVRDEAARDVDIIKIWVDDRDGQYDKLTPALYAAIIDEAHQNGLRVASHIFDREDGKGLLRAGVDVLAHGVRDQDIDDEFVALAREHPEVILIPNLPGRGVPADLDWLEGLMPPDDLAELEAANVMSQEAQRAYVIQARNLARLSDAGMRIAFGTDGNRYWGAHFEMEDMVIAGMSPADVLVSATGVSAEVLGLADEVGTIEAGKSADFIVLEANPLEDITNTRRIADVYLRGAVVDRTL